MIVKDFFDGAAAMFECYQTDLQNLPDSIKEKTTDICLSVGSKPILFLGRERFTLYRTQVLTAAELQEIVYKLCDYSVYKHVEEIRNGFIAAGGGYRVGICGTAVNTAGKLDTIKNIMSLTVRIPRIIHGAANELLQKSQSLNGGILIVGEPSSGKTTVLRDLIAQLSEKRIVVLDERFELTGGEPLSGANVLCGYSKSAGIVQAIRNLGTELIVCDELEKSDLEAVESAVSSGVSLVATVHGKISGEKKLRPLISALVQTGAFSTIAELRGRDAPCAVRKIWRADDLLENNWCNPRHSYRRGRRPFTRTATGGECSKIENLP